MDYGFTYDYQTEAMSELEAPDGYKYTLGEAISSDGSVLVGSIKNPDGRLYAAYTTNRIDWHILPIPSDEELGPWLPKEGGSAAKEVSADGKVILGHLGSFGIPIIWKMNDEGEYEADFFLPKFAKTTEEDRYDPNKILWSISAHYLGLSPNGKYAVMLGLYMDDYNQYNVPVVYNVEDQTMEIYSNEQAVDPQNRGLFPSVISDNGTFIGTIGKPIYESMGTFIMLPGETQANTYEELFPAYTEKFGMGETLGNNVPTGISADSRYILGDIFYCEDYMNPDEDAYYVTYVIDRGKDVSVDNVSSDAAPVPESIYSLDGRQLKGLTPGINIIRMTDGSVKKVMIK